MNRAGRPTAIYMHPYEFNPREFASLPYEIPWRMRLHQGMGRRRFERKIERLLTATRFGTLHEMLSCVPLPYHDPVWETRSKRRNVVEPITPLQQERQIVYP